MIVHCNHASLSDHGRSNLRTVLQTLPKSTSLSVLAVAAFSIPNAISAATVISEDFNSGTPDMTVVAGGTWGLSGGRAVLSSPADSGTNGILGNISIHNTSVSGDYTMSALMRITGTSSSWNDAALIFGYQNSNNYYYVSLNESNDGYTKGVFKVVNGSPTELADIGSSIAADTDYTLEIDRSGSSIVVELNSSQIASTTDSTFTGGQFGFGSKNDGGQFDNLVVEDNSGGGGTLTYEAETYSSTSGCSTSTQHSGYTGSGYVDFGGNGTWVEWNTINVGSSGSATLTFYYANGGSTSRDCVLTVNGSSAGTVSFPQTGNWTTWDSSSISVSLNSGNNTLRLTANGTYGGPNVDSLEFVLGGGGGGGQVATPQFSPGGGTYTSSQNVTITSSTSGATIRYTTNGSTPTSTSGTVYSGAVSISSTATLKAIAYKSGMTDSAVQSATYTINTGGGGFPNDSNTGWQHTGVTLTPMSGTVTITTDNYVLDSVDISGVLRINANNVTVKRSRVRGNGGSSAVILVQSGKSGAQIIDTEIDGLGSSNNGIVTRTNATVLRCNIKNCSDGIRPDDNTLIQDSYIYLVQAPAGAHTDGIQTYGANYVDIIHNNIDLVGPQYVNGVIFIDNGSHHITVENNLLNGGAYAFRGGSTYTVVTDNTFGQKYSSVCGIYGPVNGYNSSGTGNQWSGNVYEGGGTVSP